MRNSKITCFYHLFDILVVFVSNPRGSLVVFQVYNSFLLSCVVIHSVPLQSTPKHISLLCDILSVTRKGGEKKIGAFNPSIIARVETLFRRSSHMSGHLVTTRPRSSAWVLITGAISHTSEQSRPEDATVGVPKGFVDALSQFV